MFITKLPREIVSHILSNVSNTNDQYECMRVCKLWRRELAPVYYRDITIYKNHEKFLQDAQTKIDNNGLRIGDFVHTLTFGEIIKTVLSRESFELLIDTLLSLQVIRFDRYSLRDTVLYMKYLYRIASRTKLQEVSIVGGPGSREQYCYRDGWEFHYLINKRLKHQITTLSILDATHKSMYYSKEVFDYMNGFTGLKHLTLRNRKAYNRYGTPKAFENVTAVLDACCEGLQSLDLSLDWEDRRSINGDHKYHHNLTSLTLSVPRFGESHLHYLVDYLPNLKQLEITRTDGDGKLFSEIYASLQSDASSKLNGYMKQLHRFHCKTASHDHSNSGNSFWQTMREIYKDQTFCNLTIHFYTGNSFIYETIAFDKEGFNVDCYFEKEKLHSMAHSFDFFNLNSIQVKYSKFQGFERRLDINDNYRMSDLLTFAASQQQAQVHLDMVDEQLILSTMPVVYDDKFTFPQDLSCVQYAYLDEVQLNNILLNNMSALYPTIKHMQLINCTMEADPGEPNSSLIDLRQVKGLQELLFDIYLIQEEQKRILIQWTNCNQQRHYNYDKSISDTAMQFLKPNEVASKGIHIIKIKTFELQRLIFQKSSRILEIINT